MQRDQSLDSDVQQTEQLKPHKEAQANEESPDKGIAEIIIGKQRNGPTGSIKLKFFGEYTRFDNLAHDSVGSFE